MPGQPFQVIESLGSCQVGTVWSAVDAQGNGLTVAFLEPAVAADQLWRDAFANTAHALSQQRFGFVFADFAAPAPWVAYPAAAVPGAERIFLTLGMDYRPTPRTGPAAPPPDAPPAAPPAAPPPSVAPTPAAPPPAAAPSAAPSAAAPSAPPPAWPPMPSQPAPESSGDGEVTVTQKLEPGQALPGTPAAEPATDPIPEPVPAAAPVSPEPWSWPLRPLTDEPVPVSGGPRPAPDAAPSSGVPAPRGDAEPAFYGIGGPPRRRSRAGLWVAVAGLAVLLLAGGGAAVVALRAAGTGGPPAPHSTASASSTLKSPAPAPSPLSPGLEPPKPGSWPTQWPKFQDTDQVQTLTGMDGLDFTLKVPLSWRCVPAGRAQGYAKYFCGVSPGASPQTGGELIVRDCPKPCTEAQQTAMRKAEEAWSLQWVRTGKYSTYAESSSLQIDGAQRYGLIVVAYWRGGPDGGVDRQLVLRMAAPAEGAGQLRRVANYLRDTLIF
jgi:hypothetical protein